MESTFGVRLPTQVRAADDAPNPTSRWRRPRLRLPAPLYTVKAVSEAIPESAWRTIIWRDGKESLRRQFAAMRVHRATGKPAKERVCVPRMTTGAEGWLLVEWPLPGQKGDWEWYYSNLRADTPVECLVRLAHARGLLGSNAVRARASVDSTTTKVDPGMASIATWHWSS